MRERSLPIYHSDSWIEHEKSLIDSFQVALVDYTGHVFFDKVLSLMDTAMSDLNDNDISLIHGDLSRGNVRLWFLLTVLTSTFGSYHLFDA